MAPRGEEAESPDCAERQTAADQAAQNNTQRPKSAADKTGAVPKVPKSVSTGTLSLMIPSGRSQNVTKNKNRHALHCKNLINSLKVEVCGRVSQKKKVFKISINPADVGQIM